MGIGEKTVNRPNWAQENSTVLGIVIMPAFMLVACYFYVDSFNRFLSSASELLFIPAIFFGICFTYGANKATEKIAELRRCKTRWTTFSAITIVFDMGLLFSLYVVYMWSFFHYGILPVFM